MTILAFRDGILASDTLVTHGGARVAHTKKILRVEGWLIGACGTFGAIKPIEAWVKAGANLDSPVEFGKVDDSAAIVVDPRGKIYHVDTAACYVMEEFSPFTALGSGADVARGAMFQGATSIDAVKASIALETNCGGMVYWLGVDGTDGEIAQLE